MGKEARSERRWALPGAAVVHPREPLLAGEHRLTGWLTDFGVRLSPRQGPTDPGMGGPALATE